MKRQVPTHLLSWRLYLLLALAYFLVAHGLTAVLKQTDVVSIWLPAGIALVGCYLWWWRFFPAAFGACLLYNLSIYHGPSISVDNITPLLENIIIALGVGAVSYTHLTLPTIYSV